MIKVEIANEQSKHRFDADLLLRAVRLVLEGESVERAEVSVAIVDDATIHGLNLKYLQHDYATDVLSFLLSDPGDSLDGEIVVSADTAAREARRFSWNEEDELLLYLVHGTLHLVGLDDVTDTQRAAMRSKECHYLAQLDRHPNYEQRTTGHGNPSATTDEGETRS